MVDIGIRPASLAVAALFASAAVALGLTGGAQPNRSAPRPPALTRVDIPLAGNPSWLDRSPWTVNTRSGATTRTSVASPVAPASTSPAAATPPSGAVVTAAAWAASTAAPTTPASVTSGPATVSVTTPVAVPTTTTPEPSETAVANLVAEVEATGIAPGPTWSWSMGDPATQCGAIPGNVATGCTFGAAGSAQTVFSGSPSLALVAHELANAETENDAIPSLMSDVATAEAGTSWSSIDAVASCLVEHFMGFQDHAAGAWECPSTLAAFVAAHIHG